MSEACVILAAGAGRRMGGVNKALLVWREKSFLAHIATLCREMGTSEVVVVVAKPHAKATEIIAHRLRIACVCNPAPEQGMASSVAVGFAFAYETFASESCWLWPVDTPAIRLETLELVRTHSATRRIITPQYKGRGGHPSLVGREFWQELASCENESEGARTVFRRASEQRLHLDVDDPGVRRDVDVPADMKELPC